MSRGERQWGQGEARSSAGKRGPATAARALAARQQQYVDRGDDQEALGASAAEGPRHKWVGASTGNQSAVGAGTRGARGTWAAAGNASLSARCRRASARGGASIRGPLHGGCQMRGAAGQRRGRQVWQSCAPSPRARQKCRQERRHRKVRRHRHERHQGAPPAAEAPSPPRSGSGRGLKLRGPPPGACRL